MRHGWTLEKQNWDDLLEVISRTYWSNTKLDQSYQHNVPDSPGVYAICLKLRTMNFNQCPFKDLYEIIYIGKSDTSVRDRFLKHCRSPVRGVKKAKQCFGDRLEYWHTIVMPNQVSELEARLIECFGPPANRRQESIPARVKAPRPA